MLLMMALLCTISVLVEARAIDDSIEYDIELMEFKRSGCRQECWGRFQNCLSAKGTITVHLLCLEQKDYCIGRC